MFKYMSLSKLEANKQARNFNVEFMLTHLIPKLMVLDREQWLLFLRNLFQNKNNIILISL